MSMTAVNQMTALNARHTGGPRRATQDVSDNVSNTRRRTATHLAARAKTDEASGAHEQARKADRAGRDRTYLPALITERSRVQPPPPPPLAGQRPFSLGGEGLALCSCQTRGL